MPGDDDCLEPRRPPVELRCYRGAKNSQVCQSLPEIGGSARTNRQKQVVRHDCNLCFSRTGHWEADWTQTSREISRSTPFFQRFMPFMSQSSTSLSKPRAAFSADGDEEKSSACRGRMRDSALSSCRRIWKGIGFGVWGIAVTAGAIVGFTYEMTPVKTQGGMPLWPVHSSCDLSKDQNTLLMFVHPRCPCSRASLNELAVLMTRCNGRVNAHVIFFRPESQSDEWAKTDLWSSAAMIPHVEPHIDAGGTEHRRFGAQVSGETFLYDVDGTLVFHGGITYGRGHAGDNEGRFAIESILFGHETQRRTTPVFGCLLETASSGLSDLPLGATKGASQ